MANPSLPYVHPSRGANALLCPNPFAADNGDRAGMQRRAEWIAALNAPPANAPVLPEGVGLGYVAGRGVSLSPWVAVGGIVAAGVTVCVVAHFVTSRKRAA